MGGDADNKRGEECECRSIFSISAYLQATRVRAVIVSGVRYNCAMRFKPIYNYSKDIDKVAYRTINNRNL